MSKGTYSRNIGRDEEMVAFAKMALSGAGLLPVIEAASIDAQSMMSSTSVASQMPSLDDYFEMSEWMHDEREKIMSMIDRGELERSGASIGYKYDEHLVVSTMLVLLESAWLLHFMPAIRNYHIHLLAEEGCLEVIASWKFVNPELEALRDVVLDKYHEVADGIGYNMELVEKAEEGSPDLGVMMKILKHRVRQAGGLSALLGDIMPPTNGEGNPFGSGSPFDFPL